jgi:hypothetical protein
LSKIIKKKSCVLQTEGGIGKMIACTALVKKLKKIYEKVFVFTGYPDIFWGLADRSFLTQIDYGYEDYFKNADDVFFPSPYRDWEFRDARINLCHSYFKNCGLEYNNDGPELILKQREIDLAKKIKKEIGTFIIVQLHGGKSPYNAGQPTQPNKIAKDYPVELAEKLVDEIKKKYNIQVVNMHLPGEYPLKGTLEIKLPTRQWYALLNEAETFIAIDSNLQHAGAALRKKGIVLWGATNPKMFGYKIHDNIIGECKDIHCTRPYFVPSSDIKENQIFECPDKKCMKISTNEIIKKLPAIKNIQSPTIQLNQHICNCKYLKV